MNWFVYILKCSDGSLYTGMTNNLNKRIIHHNNKRGAKAVRGKLPVTLIHHELFESKVEAMKREAEIKKLTRDKKLRLIDSTGQANS